MGSRRHCTDTHQPGKNRIAFFCVVDKCILTYYVQNDKTKPQGFRTNATRIGGTASMINTGRDPIPPNSCIMWDFPSEREETKYPLDHQKIKGHPEGAIYPEIKVYDIQDVAGRCHNAGSEDEVHDILAEQERIIGWSLNHAEPGHQLDVILKR